MHAGKSELNDANSDKLLIILIKQFSKILCDIVGSTGNLLDYKVYK